MRLEGVVGNGRRRNRLGGRCCELEGGMSDWNENSCFVGKMMRIDGMKKPSFRMDTLRGSMSRNDSIPYGEDASPFVKLQ